MAPPARARASPGLCASPPRRRVPFASIPARAVRLHTARKFVLHGTLRAEFVYQISAKHRCSALTRIPFNTYRTFRVIWHRRGAVTSVRKFVQEGKTARRQQK